MRNSPRPLPPALLKGKDVSISMDQNTTAVTRIRVARTVEALNKNHYVASSVATKEELRDAVAAMLTPGFTVSVGGSMTLFESGIISLLEQRGDIHYLDRYRPGITPEETKKVFHDAFNADLYLSSANAITEDGKLMFIDGTGNRLAAIIYGPESVVIVAGANKIVANTAEGEMRMRQIACPANAIRLGKQVPCTKLGRCVDCRSPQGICFAFATLDCPKIPERIKVILCEEPLGY